MQAALSVHFTEQVSFGVDIDGGHVSPVSEAISQLPLGKTLDILDPDHIPAYNFC